MMFVLSRLIRLWTLESARIDGHTPTDLARDSCAVDACLRCAAVRTEDRVKEAAEG